MVFTLLQKYFMLGLYVTKVSALGPGPLRQLRGPGPRPDFRIKQSRSQSLCRHANEGSGIIHRRKQKNRVPIEKSMRQE